MAVSSDLLDHGVDHGASPTGVGSAYEHPVFHAEFGRPHGVLGQVVVELDPTVGEAGLQVGQLGVGVAQRFPEFARGGDAGSFLEVGDEFLEVVVVPAGVPFAGSSAQLCGVGFAAGSQLAFYLVDLADLVEDPGGESLVVAFCFDELAPDVGEAGDGDDGAGRLAPDVFAVGAQAVALEVAGKWGVAHVAGAALEDPLETGVGAAGVPVVEWAVVGVVVDPELAG